MSLLTLSELKTDLGITGSSQDTLLAQMLRRASNVIREYVGYYIGGVINANTLANPTVVTSYGHGLQSDDTIIIANSNCSPTIDGERVITRVSADTFTIPVNVTTAGTAGDYYRTYVEFYAGDGDNRLQLNQRPVISVASVYQDITGYYGEGPSAFASGTLLTAGTQYALKRDNGNNVEQSLSGILLRLGSVWPRAGEQLAGQLVAGRARGLGNIKVTYNAGYAYVPDAIRWAAGKLTSEFMAAAGTSGDLASESLDFYSYSKMDPASAAKALSSVRSSLNRYKGWVI